MNLKTIRRFIKNITYSEALGVLQKKAFSVVAWGWGQNRSCWSMNVIIWTDVDSCLFISRLVLKYAIYRVFFLCEATKGAGDWWNYRLTRKSNNTWKIILATDFQWIFKEQFSFKFQDNLKILNRYYVLKCESYTPQNG